MRHAAVAVLAVVGLFALAGSALAQEEGPEARRSAAYGALVERARMVERLIEELAKSVDAYLATPPGVPAKEPGFLGIRPVACGILVGAVVSGSPAEKAGLKAGDVVVSLNREPMTSMMALFAKLADLGAGAQVDLVLIREGKPVELSATLAPRPAAEAEEEEEEGEESEGPEGHEGGEVPGPSIEVVPAQPAGYLGVSIGVSDAGPRIEVVVPDSPAAVAGLQVGDVVKAVNGKPAATAHDLVLALAPLPVGAKVDLTVDRAGKEMTCTVTLAPRPAKLPGGEGEGEEGDGD